jgi:transposase
MDDKEVPECPGCRQRDLVIADLLRRVAALEERLNALLNANSSNSSMPPSANPPGAPAPVQKKKSSRKPGAQPGHPPHLKQFLPPERVNKVIVFVPERCRACATALPRDANPSDPAPSRHQVAELPELAAVVTDYQGHCRICSACGEVTKATIPAELRAHSCGPRLAATLSYLAGCHHVSKRGLEEITRDVFGVPMALGTVSALEQQMSEALAPAHEQALEAVRDAPVKHVDETGWKQAGARRWLWVAATQTVAAFLIHSRRNLAALTLLLGESIHGLLVSDRWGTYNHLPNDRRQICWAHLKRDFQKCLDRGGAGAAVGRDGLKIVRRVFKAWHTFRGGGFDDASGPCSREDLVKRFLPIIRDFDRLLERGRRCASTAVATFCTNLAQLQEAPWTFVIEENVEPTNNHAERVLRKAVLWRKNAFGCTSDRGCRFVERLLTVVQTLRLQRRPVLDFLYQSLLAHRIQQPQPALIG